MTESHKSRVVDAAREYDAAGLCVIKLRARDKKGYEGWNKQRIAADADSVFDDESNIGVRVGEPSKWVVDLDFDCHEARSLAQIVFDDEGDPLPTFGRASAPGGHMLV